MRADKLVGVISPRSEKTRRAKPCPNPTCDAEPGHPCDPGTNADHASRVMGIAPGRWAAYYS